MLLKDRGKILRSKVCDQVSEAVHPQHHTAPGFRVDSFRLWGIEAHVVGDLLAKLLVDDAFGKIGRNRGENIAPMKSVAHGLQKIMVGGDMADAQALFARIHERKHAVVRRDEIVFFGAGHDRATGAANAGIDYHQMDCACRKIRVSVRQGQRAVENIERLHGMADVDDFGIGRDVEDHSLNAADKMVVEPEIGSQRNNRTATQGQPHESWVDSKLMVLQRCVKVQKS